MKQVLMTAVAVATLTSCNNMTKTNNNPLLSDFNTPHGTAPFDKIGTEDYAPAFEAALKEAKEDIDRITSCKEAPSFENTIEALEAAGGRLNTISSIFFNLNEANTNDSMQNLALEISPKLTEFSNYVSLNDTLFQRVKTVYSSADTSTLTTEQKVLLRESYKSFARNGAELSDEQKEEYRKLTTELSTLSLQFGQNVLAATNAFKLHLTKEEELEGLPDYVKEMGASDAKGDSLEGYVFTLQAPSMIPFMKYSCRRDLREKIWRAYNSRCFGSAENNNEDIIKRITSLKVAIANLLGYKTYADFVLEERMVKNAPTVESFLNELLEKSMPYAKADVQRIKEYAAKNGADFELMPWDFSYYSDKLKDEKYAVNDELLKPYFELNNVTDGTFTLVNKLYGLTFKENKEIAPYHEDVKCYEVFDEDGSFLSVLYLDFFPRASKRGGAWMTAFKEQYMVDGKDSRPHVSLVLNFTKPTETSPSLLTFDEVTTFLHEFGHALHGMFAKGTYKSLSGTNVALDFVELPSQIMENWATEHEFLALFAKHYSTGEVIPDELIKKIIDSKNYNSGYQSVRQLSFGINDMAWHSITSAVNESVSDFEKEATAKTAVMPLIEGACFSPSFSHIFGGGYSAGYYSYKWAEVLEADAFSLFKENGIFDKATAQSFRDNILSKGNTEDAMELYVKFRGRKPEMDALLKKLSE